MNFVFLAILFIPSVAVISYGIYLFVTGRMLSSGSAHRITGSQTNTFSVMDDQISKRLEELYKAYDNCSSKYPMECGTIYEGIHRGHPSSKYKSYTTKFPIKFSVLSQSTKKCFNSSLIISVVSSPDSFINRYSYRKSYAIYKNQYPLYFFVGLSRNETVNDLIFEENKKYDDMIIFDYLSSYYNNSIQFIMSMRWLNSNCNNYRYILSQQSDTFVNIPYFQKHYEKAIENHTVISIIRRNSIVVRNNRSAWYIPESEYNETTVWPEFPAIAHIFLHKNTVKKIINASNYVKKILFMDDVYLGMLLKYSNLTNTLKSNSPSIYFYKYKDITNITQFKERILTLHEIKPGAVYYLSSKIYNVNKKVKDNKRKY